MFGIHGKARKDFTLDHLVIFQALDDQVEFQRIGGGVSSWVEADNQSSPYALIQVNFIGDSSLVTVLTPVTRRRAS